MEAVSPYMEMASTYLLVGEKSDVTMTCFTETFPPDY
jgi:hypothetical protein